MIAIFVFLIIAVYLSLSLCAAAKRGDARMASALGIDLAEPAYRVIRKNRKAHRLARWLAFHRAVKRV